MPTLTNNFEYPAISFCVKTLRFRFNILFT